MAAGQINLSARIAELEERFTNFTNEYDAAVEFQAQNADIFFLLTMACIVFRKYSNTAK